MLKNGLRNGTVAPKLIEDRPSNSLIGKCRECCFPIRVKLAGSFDEMAIAKRPDCPTCGHA